MHLHKITNNMDGVNVVWRPKYRYPVNVSIVRVIYQGEADEALSAITQSMSGATDQKMSMEELKATTEKVRFPDLLFSFFRTEGWKYSYLVNQSSWILRAIASTMTDDDFNHFRKTSKSKSRRRSSTSNWVKSSHWSLSVFAHTFFQSTVTPFLSIQCLSYRMIVNCRTPVKPSAQSNPSLCRRFDHSELLLRLVLNFSKSQIEWNYFRPSVTSCKQFFSSWVFSTLRGRQWGSEQDQRFHSRLLEFMEWKKYVTVQIPREEWSEGRHHHFRCA